MQTNMFSSDSKLDLTQRQKIEIDKDHPFPNVSNAHIECKDNLALTQKLPSEMIELIVTSPPFNIGKAYEKRGALECYLKAQAKVIFECVRLLDPRGSICWQVGNHITTDGEVVPLDVVLYELFKQHGLYLRNRIVWHIEHGLHCSKRFSGRYETILWFTKSKEYTFNLDPIRVPSKYPNKRYFKRPRIGQLSCNPLGKNSGDLWIIPNVKNNHIEKTAHPRQFPVELVERLVLSMTDEGDSVFDPYMGVGSAVIAALMHGRDGYGCDIVQEYLDIASERIQILSNGCLRTRPMGKPVYDPSLLGGGHQ
ncbi:MAG: site-specific DNA-methyltransferase [Dehalococcoidia bacterium]|nr:site-specific DNA-methyltransferase [Dehalococcoidia bacterium]